MSQSFTQSMPVPVPVSQGGTGVVTSTGTGSVVLSNSPTLVTPTLGAATATSLTFSPTTGGIVGTATNNNTNAGNVGEVVTATASGISLTGNVSANITSISVTAGDWDVYGIINYTPAASTTTTYTLSSINTTSATQATYSTTGGARIASTSSGYAVNMTRISVSVTTTIYLVGLAQFAVSTMTGAGTITARRRR